MKMFVKLIYDVMEIEINIMLWEFYEKRNILNVYIIIRK